MIEPRLIEGSELMNMAYDIDRPMGRDFVMTIRRGFNKITILDGGSIQFRILYDGGLINEPEYDIRCGANGVNMVSASQALDFIIEFYPEYATWFLFHPELF